MTSGFVDDGRSDDEPEGAAGLFAGQKLWFSRAVPSRSWIIEKARQHGATIVDVNMEHDADIKLVDHAKKPHAPGTHSYKYVLDSIAKGRLEDLADHAVGLDRRSARPVGSAANAPRTGRRPYTEEEDQFLWNWMKPFEDRDGQWKGNEIYKQIESVNHNHPWQSWRDRWIKHTRFQHRRVTAARLDEPQQTWSADQPSREPELVPELVPEPEPLAGNGHRRNGVHHERLRERVSRRATPHLTADPETPPRSSLAARPDVVVLRESSNVTGGVPKSPGSTLHHQSGVQTSDDEAFGPTSTESAHPFTKGEFRELYSLVPMVTNFTAAVFDKVWAEIATSESFTPHSPGEWARFFESRVVPAYCKKEGCSVAEIAPYMRDRIRATTPKSGAEGASDADVTQPSDAQPSPAKNLCSICFSQRTRPGEPVPDAGTLCPACALLGSQPSQLVRRLASLNASRHADASLPAWSSTQASRSPQREQGAQQTPSPSPRSDSRCLELGRRPQASPGREGQTRSPSFQQSSPVLSRPPKSTDAPRDQAEKAALLHPTQSTDVPSQVSSHDSKGPEPQPTMGNTESRETSRARDLPAKITLARQYAEIPPFLLPAAAGQKRKRLRDEPGHLDVQQVSSLSTDGGPPRGRAPVHLTTSDPDVQGDDRLPGGDTATSTTREPSQSWPESPLLVPPNESHQSNRGTSSSPIEIDSNPSQRVAHEPVSEDTLQPELTEVMSVDDGTAHHREQDVSPVNHSARRHDELASQQYETAFESWSEREVAGEPRNERIPTPDLFDRIHVDENDRSFLEIPDPPGGWADFSQDSWVMPPDQTATGVQQAASERGRETAFDTRLATGHIPAAKSTSIRAATGRETRRQQPKQPQVNGAALSTWWADEMRLFDANSPLGRRDFERLLARASRSTGPDFRLARELVDVMLGRLKAECRRRDRSRSPGKLALSDEALEHLIPRDRKGVWTQFDDDILRTGDARGIERLQRKHGSHDCDTRWCLLEFMGD